MNDQSELEQRLWEALDALVRGSWTAEDISVIRYVTGTNYKPEEIHAAEH